MKCNTFTYPAELKQSFPRLAGHIVVLAVLVTTGLTVSVAAQGKSSEAGNDYGIPQVKFINEQIRSGWKENQLTPSTAATDPEWCRRVYLDILGRIPSVEELSEFVLGRESNKKDKLVSKLLYDDKYTEEYARNWTTLWTVVLIGRAGGTEDNTLTSREGMQKYLRDCFARNKPYNNMVYELVTATGANSPGAPDFNGAVNFLAMKVNEEKGTLATAATAKVFLGLQVQCTQCHNHPFNDWKQQKFWEFNAFFRQTRARPKFLEGTRDIASSELVNEDFGGEGSNPQEAEIYYELRNGLLKVAYPVFVDGTEISKSGHVTEVNRREELGKLMLKSEYLDMCVANRYWSHFLGYGFTKPIDDMGPHNAASHPTLVEYLGKEIRKNSYNLKELIHWITLSEAYSLSSKITNGNRKDDPLMGETPRFSHFYLRQMRAEELYHSLLVATKAATSQGSYEEQERAKQQWLSQFTLAFGNDEGEEATTFNGTIPQALMMFNGDMIQKAISVDKGSFLADLAQNTKMKPQQKIEFLFMSALARKPSKDELAATEKLFTLHAQDRNIKGDPVKASLAAVQDVWWAVLNSNEFIINH
jgi:hypothetical protein